MLQQAVQSAICILNAVQGKKKKQTQEKVMPENVSQQKERE